MCYCGTPILVTTQGMIPNANKVKAIQNWPTSTTVTEVQRFLGLASYYRRYIKTLPTLLLPLQTKVYNSNGQTLSLQHSYNLFNFSTDPEMSLPFTLYTDASDTGLGVVLHQAHNVIA